MHTPEALTVLHVSWKLLDMDAFQERMAHLPVVNAHCVACTDHQRAGLGADVCLMIFTLAALQPASMHHMLVAAWQVRWPLLHYTCICPVQFMQTMLWESDGTHSIAKS